MLAEGHLGARVGDERARQRPAARAARRGEPAAGVRHGRRQVAGRQEVAAPRLACQPNRSRNHVSPTGASTPTRLIE